MFQANARKRAAYDDKMNKLEEQMGGTPCASCRLSAFPLINMLILLAASEGVAAERMEKLQKARYGTFYQGKLVRIANFWYMCGREASRKIQKNDMSERRKLRAEEQAAFEEEFNTMLQVRLLSMCINCIFSVVILTMPSRCHRSAYSMRTRAWK
jgi:hypothetical protein